MDKKINLEHTIRVIVSESLGSGVTTDKYTRTGNSFFKSVHIEPKRGDEHVPLNGAVRTGRNVNKERSSETMKEEEQIDEFLKPVVGLAVKHGDEVVDLLGDLLKTRKPSNLPAVKPTKAPEKLPFKEPTPQKPIELPPTAPANVPATVPKKAPTQTPPAVTPAAPKTPPAVTPGTPKAPPAVSPVTPKAPPAVKTPTIAPAPVTVPKIGTSLGAKLGVAGAVATAVGTAIATKFKTKTKDKGEGPTPPGKPPRPGKDGGIIVPPFGLPAGGASDIQPSGSGKTIDVSTYTHRAGKRTPDRFSEEINPKDAEEIKVKTRKAQIIRKIIDEQKKKKDTSTVDLHPKLKNQEPDQN